MFSQSVSTCISIVDWVRPRLGGSEPRTGFALTFDVMVRLSDGKTETRSFEVQKYLRRTWFLSLSSEEEF